MATSKKPAFQYTALNESNNEIRLLKIINANIETVECELYHVALDRDTAYKALSYTWGDAKAMKRATINGSDMGVTENLEAALRALAAQNEQSALWIDAICINQTDIQERNMQVQRMRDIYSQAAEVILWLGPESEDSHKAFELMSICWSASPLSNIKRTPIDDEILVSAVNWEVGGYKDHWMALARLSGRPYWKRAWIIQEVALAQEITLICGNETASWPMVEITVLFWSSFGRHQSTAQDIITNFGGIVPIWYLLKIRTAKLGFDKTNIYPEATPHSFYEKPIGLLEAMFLFSVAEATDPRDKVYAFLGLAEDGKDLVPTPNYRKPVAIVFSSITQSIINQRGYLDIICLQGKTDRSHLPSWVPNWQNPRTESIAERFFNWNNPRGRATGDSYANISFISQDICIARGVIIDHVDGLGCLNPKLLPRNRDNNPALCGVIQSQKCPTQSYGNRDAIFEAIWRSLFLNMTEPMSGKAEAALPVYGMILLMEIYGLSEPSETKICHAYKKDFEDWHARNKNFRVTDEETLDNFLYESINLFEKKLVDEWLAPLEENNPDFKTIETVMLGLIHIDHYRRIMSTEKGYLGMAPNFTRQGDAIFLLEGCSVLVILRRWEGHWWTLVGDTYVHDIMDGAIWEEARNHLSDFCLI